MTVFMRIQTIIAESRAKFRLNIRGNTFKRKNIKNKDCWEKGKGYTFLSKLTLIIIAKYDLIR